MMDGLTVFGEEQGVLFSIHTVFRVDDINQITDNTRQWEVQLTITSENDPQLASVTDHMKKEIQGKGWYRMTHLTLKVGHFDQAEELFNGLLVNHSNDKDTIFIYRQFESLKQRQGTYQKAATFYEKTLEIDPRTIPEDDTSSTPVYGNIAALYKQIGDYTRALELYEKLYKIGEQPLPPYDQNFASYSDNIGEVYKNMGDYSKAVASLEKALIITQKSLPSTHPDIKETINSIEIVKKQR
ncbi:unnamed protein product [Rotaria magnacalcarata]|uniref:Tetratricopeptide repeat protein n=1 Tax=Rotaria magnacalcarata TaxID=392030 RepID=A0A816G3C0_9BILA|nr:unnamed protein product [Rotaria magnacalcarata]CAF1669698.1 unnamed protein product [Rotaria magnacalcarata]CAF1923316.1 unnamed protein product [Rotaria magnacalcarata]CAF4113648.1 unnamed protein product [Rotaria magnacalcarata]CAF4256821.1 unnamed protein product [Rotaria magnacalcarata]